MLKLHAVLENLFGHKNIWHNLATKIIAGTVLMQKFWYRFLPKYAKMVKQAMIVTIYATFLVSF
jgi:hypothetical protein